MSMGWDGGGGQKRWGCDIVWSQSAILPTVTKQCQPVGISPPQSSGVQWSPVESTGVHWTQSRVESTGLAKWTGVHWSPTGVHRTRVQQDWQYQYMIWQGTQSRWSPVESSGVQVDYVGEGKGLPCRPAQGWELPGNEQALLKVSIPSTPILVHKKL